MASAPMATVIDQPSIPTILLNSAHIKTLYDGNWIKPNQNGLDLVNFDGAITVTPKIHDIMSFTIQVSNLPPNATTFGSLYKNVISTSAGSASQNVFASDDENHNIQQRVIAILLSMAMVITQDATAGSPPHVDVYKIAMDQINNLLRIEEAQKHNDQQQEAPSSKKGKKKDGKESASKDDTSAMESSDESSKKKKKKKKKKQTMKQRTRDFNEDANKEEEEEEEKEKEDDDEEENEKEKGNDSDKEITEDEKQSKEKGSKSSSSSDSSKSSSDSSVEEDQEKEPTAELESTTSKKTTGPKRVTRRKSVALNEGRHNAAIQIARKTNKDDNDLKFHHQMENLQMFSVKRDLRGICTDENSLYFTHNGKTYPKVRIFVEELEGHSSMKYRHVPVTNRVRLPRTDDRLKEILQTKEERNASGNKIGNGFLVGLRIWLFVLDPTFNFCGRIKRMIQERNKRTYRETIQPNKNPEFVAPLNNITNESQFYSNVLLPYASSGSSFRQVIKDPVVKDITSSRQSTRSKGFQSGSKNGGNELVEKGTKIAMAKIVKDKYDRPFHNDEDVDARKDYNEGGRIRHISPQGILRETENREKDLPIGSGIINSAFISNIECVCESQKDPSNYYKIPEDVSLKASQQFGVAMSSKTVLKNTSSSSTNNSSKNNKSKPNNNKGKDIVKKDDPEDYMDIDTDPFDKDPSNNLNLLQPFTRSSSSSSSSSSLHKNINDNSEDENSVIIEDVNQSSQNDEDGDIDMKDDTSISEDRNVLDAVNNIAPNVVHIQKNGMYSLENGKIIFGSNSPDEHENKLKSNFLIMSHIKPNAFKGFPHPHLVTEYSSKISGTRSYNWILPHILREVEDEPVCRILEIRRKQQELKKKAIRERRQLEDYERASLATDHGENDDDILGDIVKNTGNIDQQHKEAPVQKFAPKKYSILSAFQTIHNARIPVTRLLTYNGDDFDEKMGIPKTTDELKESTKRLIEQMNQSDTAHCEATDIIKSDGPLCIQTSKDVRFKAYRSREFMLTEIARNQLTGSELEHFASKNDLLMLRLQFCSEAARIGCQYDRSNNSYKRAMRELRSRHTNNFAHVIQNSTRLPKSFKTALEWYKGMAARNRQFGRIPMRYKQFGIFGNFFQFVRAVLAEVLIGRNNVELFFNMYFVYLSSLCYSFYLRPNLIVSGPGSTSKSFTKDATAQLAVEGTFTKPTHCTGMHLMVEEHFYYTLHAYDEAPVYISSAGSARGSYDSRSDAGGGGDRLMKETIASQKARIRTFFFLKCADGKSRRMADEIATVLQITILMLCNVETLGPDSPLMQRFLLFVQPKKIAKHKLDDHEERNPNSMSAKILRSSGVKMPALSTKKLDNTSTNTTNSTANNNFMDDSNGGPIIFKPTDLARMCFENRDYQDSADEELKETLQLVSFYCLFHEVMITAMVTDDISVDLTERFLPEIFDRFTADIHAPPAPPRLMMQACLLSRAMANVDAVVTCLFTDIMYPDLRKEKTLIVDTSATTSANSSSSSSSSALISNTPNEEFRMATSLNISKFRKYMRMHSYVKAEHVATTATIMEHYVANPYFFPVVQAIIKAVKWPASITLANIRGNSRGEESSFYSVIRREKLGSEVEQFYDARYLCMTESEYDILHERIHESMSDQISKNDVIRTLRAQRKQFIPAHACLVMNNNWDIVDKSYRIGRTDKKKDEKSDEDGKTQKKSDKVKEGDIGSKPKEFAKRRDDSERALHALRQAEKKKKLEEKKNKNKSKRNSRDESEESDYDDEQGDGNSSSSISSGSDNEEENVDGDKSSKSTEYQAIFESQKKWRGTDRYFFEKTIIGYPEPVKFYQPDNIAEMQDWLRIKYSGYTVMRETLFTSEEERSLLGITRYMILNSTKEVWMMFAPHVIPPEHSPIIRNDTEVTTQGGNGRKRISVLIEYADHGNRKDMKSAIQVTFASNSIPKEGVIYQSVKPYIGINSDGKREASAYLTNIIQIGRKEQRSIYCLNPIPSRLSGRKYIDLSTFRLGGMDNEYSPYTRVERQLERLSAGGKSSSSSSSTTSTSSMINSNNNNDEDDDEDDEGDEENLVDSDSDEEDMGHNMYKSILPKQAKKNPYFNDQEIRNLIRNSDGINFCNKPLDDFAQLRHWFRCGIDPTRLTAVEIPGSVTDNNANITTIVSGVKRYALESNIFLTMMIRDMLTQIEDDPLCRDSICSEYQNLWTEEQKANKRREERCEGDCVKLTDLMGCVYNGDVGSSITKDSNVTKALSDIEKRITITSITDKYGTSKSVKIVPITEDSSEFSAGYALAQMFTMNEENQEKYNKAIVSEGTAPIIDNLFEGLKSEESRIGADLRHMESESRKAKMAMRHTTAPPVLPPTSFTKNIEERLKPVDDENDEIQLKHKSKSSRRKKHSSTEFKPQLQAPWGKGKPVLETKLSSSVTPPKGKSRNTNAPITPILLLFGETNRGVKRKLSDDSPHPIETPIPSLKKSTNQDNEDEDEGLEVSSPVKKKRKLSFSTDPVDQQADAVDQQADAVELPTLTMKDFENLALTEDAKEDESEEEEDKEEKEEEEKEDADNNEEELKSYQSEDEEMKATEEGSSDVDV